MKCPHCDHTETTLLESLDEEGGVRRRYECPSCGRAFATEERVPRATVMVVKRDSRRETFQREKLQRSIRVAASKRPLATGALDAIVEDIEDRLVASGRTEIASRVIGEMAITQLKRLDPIAYIRYASLYRQFVSLDDMMDELSQMAASPIPPPEQRRLFEDDMERAVQGEGELPRAPTPIGSLRTSFAF
jgi:transcriptional repressor NrdR